MHNLESNLDIQEIIKAYILNNSNFNATDNLAVDDNLLEQGIMDSLGIAEMTEFIETEFNIVIDEDEILVENYRSLGTLATFCKMKLSVLID